MFLRIGTSFCVETQKRKNLSFSITSASFDSASSTYHTIIGEHSAKAIPKIFVRPDSLDEPLPLTSVTFTGRLVCESFTTAQPSNASSSSIHPAVLALFYVHRRGATQSSG